MSKVYVGGQAIIEGVMMKGVDKVAAAVRTKKGIKIEVFPFHSLTKKNFLLRLPFIRGVIFLGEMLVIGLKTLSWSANQQAGKDEQISSVEMTITMVISFVLGIGLFVGLPYFLSWLLAEQKTVAFNVLDGIFRLAVFLGYLLLISMMKDVKRLFQYHGAEHKAVHCYEAKLPLIPKNVQKFSTIHPRCGTSLIVFVIAVSIVVFSLIQFDAWYWNVLSRVIVIPLIAGISYELLKFTATSRFFLLRMIAAPGMWVQKITTKQPTDDQVEVAIAALKKVI